MLRFKDMFPMGIEYRPGEDELTNYRALRRKRTIGVGEGGPIGESNENPVDAYMDAGKHAKGVTIGYAFKHKKIKDPVTGHTILVHQLASEDKTVCPKCEGKGCDHCDGKGYHIKEALSVAMRLKKARDFRKNKAKVKLGQQRAKRRMADMNVLRRRARKAAYKLVYQKITKNIPKDELSPQRKAEIEKRMSKPAMKAKVERVARKMMRTVRQRELDRKKAKATGQD